MKILYLDAFAGISGDMTVGALLALGLPLEHLRGELSQLALGGDVPDRGGATDRNALTPRRHAPVRTGLQGRFDPHPVNGGTARYGLDSEPVSQRGAIHAAVPLGRRLDLPVAAGGDSGGDVPDVLG